MQENNNSQVNLVDILLFILNRWWIILISAAVCMGIAYYRYSKMPLMYRSQATVMIKSPANTRASSLVNYSSLVNTVSN